MRALLFGVVFALVLSSCASHDVAKSAIASCGAYAQALSTLATLRANGRLGAAAVAKVNAIDRQVGPLCDPTKPVPTSAVQIAGTVVEAAVIDLKTLIEGVQ